MPCLRNLRNFPLYISLKTPFSDNTTPSTLKIVPSQRQKRWAAPPAGRVPWACGRAAPPTPWAPPMGGLRPPPLAPPASRRFRDCQRPDGLGPHAALRLRRSWYELVAPHLRRAKNPPASCWTSYLDQLATEPFGWGLLCPPKGGGWAAAPQQPFPRTRGARYVLAWLSAPLGLRPGLSPPHCVGTPDPLRGAFAPAFAVPPKSKKPGLPQAFSYASPMVMRNVATTVFCVAHWRLGQAFHGSAVGLSPEVVQVLLQQLDFPSRCWPKLGVWRRRPRLHYQQSSGIRRWCSGAVRLAMR